MSNTPQWSFSAMVPGFDFLQNLVKGASGGIGQMPHLASWVAPTIDVQELQKRIDDLKAVQFWLEQNARALAATVQALEVQKMTLGALQGMNVGFADMVQNFQPAKSAPASAPATPAKEPEPAQAAKAASGADKQDDGPKAETQAAPAASMLDPMQWWGALTQQFQHIATQALQEMAAPAAQGAPAAVQEALQSAAGAASQVGQMAAQSWQGMQEAAQKMAQAATGQKSPPAADENAAASRRSATSKGAPRKAAASGAAPARRPASKKASAPARKSAAGKGAR